ncbi:MULTISPECIES: hypothetical protein [Flavobacteriaceae]|uniref:hypothetical protein n=1 Tax=Flavobacteriaceae TaxID=49546 RepID=UPI001491E0E8|nr:MULTISPECIES: hypothetical protein [Allomuricauda]MDC6367793.1 hypothetical protein [Muricauda sp. AC10]
MKRNKTYITKVLFMAVLLLNWGCDDKDQFELVNDSKPLVVQTSDFNLTIEEGEVIIGDTLGIVQGTSNKGTVSFEFASQTPENSMRLDAVTGVLTVADESLFIAETQVQGTVTVSKDNVAENMNITITVEEATTACPSPIFNVFTWTGNLNSEDVGFGTSPAVGLPSPSCDQLIIQGDILGYGCELVPEIVLTFTPDSEGATTGTVNGTQQSWECFEGENFALDFPFDGTYNETTGVIQIGYEFYFEGEFSFDGQLIITPNCESTVDTSIWSGNLNAEDVGFSTSQAEGVASCGKLLIKGDVLGYGCENMPEFEITLNPSSDEATSGTVSGGQQTWNCFEGENFELLILGGTYDEISGEIAVDYEFYAEGEFSFDGQLLVSPE